MAPVLVSSVPVSGPYPGGATLAPRSTSSVLFLCEDFTRPWGDNLCAPYYILQDNGVQVNFATLDGGSIPIASAGGPFTRRFRDDDKAMGQSRRRNAPPPFATVWRVCISLLRTRILNFSGCVYDAIYVPGGDALERHQVIVDLLQAAVLRGRVLAALGPRGVAALLPLRAPSGRALLSGARVAGLGLRPPPEGAGDPPVGSKVGRLEGERGVAEAPPRGELPGDWEAGAALAAAAAAQGAVDGGAGAAVDGALITAATTAWPAPPPGIGAAPAEPEEVAVGRAIVEAVTSPEGRAAAFPRWCHLTGRGAAPAA